MAPNDLFDKIVKLEETSEEITNNSLKNVGELKKLTKNKLEVLVNQHKEEKDRLINQLNKERLEEEKLLKAKYNDDFNAFSLLLTEKFKNNIQTLINQFKEKNKI